MPPVPNRRKQAQIARINELSQLARTAWFALLGYLVFVGITLLGVEDADFFISSRQTQLPLIGVQIPTASFFWTAPVLGAALYTYLHLFLIKLWDAHVPPTRDSDATHHWLVGDFVLLRQGDPTARARPLAWLSAGVTVVLVWIAGPFVLAYAWWRSMPAHEEWLTLLISLCLYVSLYVGVSSWWTASARLRATGRSPWSALWRRVLGGSLAIVLVVVSWLRTEGGLDHYANRLIDFADAAFGTRLLKDCAVHDSVGDPIPGRVRGDCVFENGDLKDPADIQRDRIAASPWIPKNSWLTFGEEDWPLSIWLRDANRFTQNTWSPLARTDLRGIELVDLPEFWREPETARATFRKTWCEREGLSMTICDHAPSPERPEPVTLASARAAWCAGHAGVNVQACLDQFVALDDRFEAAWAEERKATLAILPRLSLAGRDLRNVWAYQASLVGADLRRARLEGAGLAGARLEGADLSRAQLEGADLSSARLEGANLRGARLEGTFFLEAWMPRVRLEGAQLKGANLMSARLEGARLSGAGLEGADLSGAHLREASLFDASLEGANLQLADLRGAALEGAKLDGALLHFADMRADFGFANLAQTQLSGAIGNEHTLLPDFDAMDTRKPFTISSCWDDPPAHFERIVAMAAGPFPFAESLDARRFEFLCGPTSPRREVGKPMPLEAPYPDGHPLAGRKPR